VNKIEREKKRKIDAIEQNKQKLTTEITKIEEIIASTNDKISRFSRARLVESREQISDNLHELTTTPMSGFVIPAIDTDFETQIEPKFASAYFVVENFGEVRWGTDALFSNLLTVHGLSWKLKVYPGGNEASRNNYMAVFIQLADSIPGHKSADYTYRIQIIRDQENNFEREFTSEFQVGECWGYNRFYKLDQIEPFVQSDSIRFRFHIRPTTHDTAYRDLTNYVKHLERELILTEGNMGETQGLINQSMEQFPLDESQANGPEAVNNEEILSDEESEEDDDDEDDESEELTEISTTELMNSINLSEGEVDNQIQEINTMELLERYEGRRRGNALRDHLRQNGRESGLNIDQLLNYPSNET